MGRSGRKVVIDKKAFENLCGLQCTKEEIAAFFDCDLKTVYNFCMREYGKTFVEVFDEKKHLGKISLRRKQWKLADSNPTMAIFLGKNILGQTDTSKISLDLEDIQPLSEVLGVKEKEETIDNGNLETND